MITTGITSFQTTALLASSSRILNGLVNAHPLAHLELCQDPSLRLRTMIEGDGGMAGGGISNPLAELFPGGHPPTDAQALGRIVEAHDLTETLEGGTILAWLRETDDAVIPQFHTLALLPVSHGPLYRTVIQVDDWSTWMPRFEMSRSELGAAIVGSRYQIAKTNSGVRTFHYRVHIENEQIPGGSQIRWQLAQEGFEPDPGTTGLRINRGSWTFAAAPHDRRQTLMAYQIQVEPDILPAFLKSTRLIIEPATLKEFNKAVEAMANRTLDPNWSPQSATHPSQRSYHVERIRT